MAEAEDNVPKFNGLNKLRINCPLILKDEVCPLDFASEDTEVIPLTRDQCANFTKTISGLGDRLVNEGAVKFKLPDPKITESEFFKRYNNVPNGGYEDEEDDDEEEMNQENVFLKSATLPAPIASDFPAASSRSSTRIQAIKRAVPVLPDPVKKKKIKTVSEMNKIAKLPKWFVMLYEIRNLGHGMFAQQGYTPQQAVQILPELKGITMGQLAEFYDTVFGPCEEGNVESQIAYVQRYYQILESLPVDPGRKILGTNGKSYGLLVPYTHSFRNFQLNNDEDLTGMEMDCLEGPLLDEARFKSGKRTGKLIGINNAMLFFGVPGSTFPEHVEDGNAIGSVNFMPHGIVKFWKIVLGKYCNAVRENVQRVLKQLVKEGLDDTLTEESQHICVLQHKNIILSPQFYKNCKPDPIPYKIFFQRKAEMMLIGTAVHHGGASGGILGTIGRATNVLTPDYNRMFPLGFKQCDGHGKRGIKKYVIADDTIAKFRDCSAEMESIGHEEQTKRAIEKALAEQRQVQPNKTTDTSSTSSGNPDYVQTDNDFDVEHLDTPEESSSSDETESVSIPSKPKWKRNKERTTRKLSDNIKCPDCGQRFQQQKDLKTHTDGKACLRDNKCDFCHRKFRYWKVLKNHIPRCKANPAEENDEEEETDASE